MRQNPAAPVLQTLPRRHGPYFEVTYKASDKTVNVKLSPEARLPCIEPLPFSIESYEDSLLRRLEKLSQTILRSSEPNWPNQHPQLTTKPGVIPISRL